jgi:hypothetical protein
MMQIDPNFPAVLNRLGYVYAEAGEIANAVASAISKLEGLATSSRDLVVENAYESARGFALFQQGDFPSAADELATDSRSPLALQQLAFTQEKLGKPDAAQSTRTLLKYQRGPAVEWFLVTHPDTGKSQ